MKKGLLWTLGIIVGLGIMGQIFGTGESDPNDPSVEADDTMAKVMCEEFVGRRLKAPGTASYSPVWDTRVTRSGDRYTVDGYVDAENSFGARLRKQYHCVVEDEGETWRRIELVVLD